MYDAKFVEDVNKALALLETPGLLDIIEELDAATLHFADLATAVDAARSARPGRGPLSKQRLLETLQIMESTGLITSHMDPSARSRSYAITEHGRELIAATQPLVEWAEEYFQKGSDGGTTESRSGK